jgi:hypothetical protein
MRYTILKTDHANATYCHSKSVEKPKSAHDASYAIEHSAAHAGREWRAMRRQNENGQPVPQGERAAQNGTAIGTGLAGQQLAGS